MYTPSNFNSSPDKHLLEPQNIEAFKNVSEAALADDLKYIMSSVGEGFNVAVKASHLLFESVGFALPAIASTSLLTLGVLLMSHDPLTTQEALARGLEPYAISAAKLHEQAPWLREVQRFGIIAVGSLFALLYTDPDSQKQQEKIRIIAKNIFSVKEIN